MMFKSKHSGWSWDLKRTPFGGGGGISNGFGIGDALASIDPGPAIGSAGASIDKAVNDNIPGGWITVGGLAAGGLALAYAPEVMAFAEANGIAPSAASTELGIPAVNATTGEVVAPDMFAGYSATGSAAGTAGSQLTASEIAALNAGGASGVGAGTSAGIETGYGGASSVGNLNPAVAGEIGGNTTTGTFGSLNPALPATGSAGSAGGISAQLAPGTVLGTGLEGGGTIGSTYAAGANGLPATDFFGNYIPASSMNLGGIPSTIAGTGYTIPSELVTGLKVASIGNSVANLLKQGSASGLSNSLGKLAQGANSQGQNLGAVVRGNQNPFTYQPQQPIQDTRQAQLAKLLQQG